MNELDIFAMAMELGTPQERAQYLAETCGGDTTLRARIEALLRSSDKAGSFLETPPSAVATSVEELRAATPDGISLGFLRPSDRPGSLGRLDYYEILEIVGSGGMGIVLKARDEKLQRIVAIKMMAEALAASPIARRRFVGEAQAAAAIRDDHVVSIYAVEDSGPIPYLVMELISGVSLQQRLEQTGPLEMRDICRIGMQIALGLAAAHAQGVIHRDIKPANILLENSVGRVKITDFGLARVADDASTSQTGLIAGTPQYMSPEQARGDIIDPRSDLFSLGSTLYAMCTGRAPFRASSAIAVLKRVCEHCASPIREANPSIPQWLVDLIDQLQAKDPAERVQSAGEVAEQLRQYLAGRLDTADPPAVSRPTRTSGNARWALTAAAAVLLCLVGALSLTEATGVTRLVPTVIHIVTGEGTLVVETDDPAVKVTVEGDGGLVITGAGLEELRLRPGSYRVHADKGGQSIPLDKDLVTVARGDREIVKVKLETSSAPVVLAERNAFVLLGGKGLVERKFDTLADAVRGASDGDTIEIRGNGPFVSPPINFGTHALTIRAGEGCRPAIEFRRGSLERRWALIAGTAPITLEGLEFRSGPPEPDQGPVGIDAGSFVHVANCRFLLPYFTCVWSEEASRSRCILRNCEFLSYEEGTALAGVAPPKAEWIMDNCVQVIGNALSHNHWSPNRESASIQLSRCTLVGRNRAINLSAIPGPTELGECPEPLRLRLSASIIDSESVMHAHYDERVSGAGKTLPAADLEAHLERLLEWRGQQNVYSLRTDPDLPVQFLASGKGKLAMPTVIDPPHGPTDLAGWGKMWRSPETGSIEGRARFQGGDLLAKAALGPEKITPDDFRLRPDSAGYRAGPDGKDLGADVDLVGPGPAYERWKKTPEYQEWLKDTGQRRAEVPTKEPGAFVLLGGKGVGERKFDTLAEAILHASDDDTIEVRGNGPFVTDPIQIENRTLTIRAGAGFRPVVRLSPNNAHGNEPLLFTKAMLVLEGLEMQRFGQKEGQNIWPRASLVNTEDPLRAANCRFVVTGAPWQTCVYSLSRHVALTNCEFICPGSSCVCSFTPTDRQLNLDNCIHLGICVDCLHYDGSPTEGSDVFIKRCTLVSSHGDGLFVAAYMRAPDSNAPLVKKVCVEAAGNVFVTPTAMRFWQTPEHIAKTKRLGPGELEELLPRLFSWRDRGNVYGTGSASIVWDAPDITIRTTLGKPADWKKYWGDTDGELSEGTIRLQGGNLAARAATEALKITPEDFRLRPDSAGYRAGKDGKDLGADVDLVGPGPAYERWKKTPEYQQWLKETGQEK